MEGRCLTVLHCTSSLIDEHAEAKPGDRPEGSAMGADEEGPRSSACQRPRPGDRPITMFGEDFDNRVAEQAAQSRSDALHLGPGGSDDEYRPSRPEHRSGTGRQQARRVGWRQGVCAADSFAGSRPSGPAIERTRREFAHRTPIAGSDGQAGWPGAAEKNRQRGHVVLRRPAKGLEKCGVKYVLGTGDGSDLAEPRGGSLSQTDDEAANHPPAEWDPDDRPDGGGFLEPIGYGIGEAGVHREGGQIGDDLGDCRQRETARARSAAAPVSSQGKPGRPKWPYAEVGV